MKWNKKKALEIQAKYNLSDVTVRNWKMNNYIPDQYRGMKYVPPIPASTKQIRRFEKIVSQPYFVRSGFDALPKHRYRDHFRGGGQARLRVEELGAFFVQVDDLLQLLEQFIQSPSQALLYALIKDKRIKNVAFIEDASLLLKIRRQGTITPTQIKYAKKRASLVAKYLK